MDYCLTYLQSSIRTFYKENIMSAFCVAQFLRNVFSPWYNGGKTGCSHYHICIVSWEVPSFVLCMEHCMHSGGKSNLHQKYQRKQVQSVTFCSAPAKCQEKKEGASVTPHRGEDCTYCLFFARVSRLVSGCEKEAVPSIYAA